MAGLFIGHHLAVVFLFEQRGDRPAVLFERTILDFDLFELGCFVLRVTNHLADDVARIVDVTRSDSLLLIQQSVRPGDKADSDPPYGNVARRRSCGDLPQAAKTEGRVKRSSA